MTFRCASDPDLLDDDFMINGGFLIRKLPIIGIWCRTGARPMPTFARLAVSVSNAAVTCRSAPSRNERQLPVQVRAVLYLSGEINRFPASRSGL